MYIEMRAAVLLPGLVLILLLSVSCDAFLVTTSRTHRLTLSSLQQPLYQAARRSNNNNNNKIDEEELWYDRSLINNNTSRRPIVAGNWKLNPNNFNDCRDLIKLLSSNFINHRTSIDADVVVFPPFPYLSFVIQELEGTGIKVGAQNVSLLKGGGAYTGEVSASMVHSLGCDYVLLGHSERRTLFEETDDIINQKVHICLDQPNLQVILCIGETEKEYENELLENVIALQVKKGLAGVKEEDLDRIIIAYEPVWAIGTGKVATPEQAQEAHEVTRRVVQQMYGFDAASQIRIQYGGSVSPESIESLMGMMDVDGALVGGASLNADSFSRIVDGVATVYSDKSSLHSHPPKELSAREVISCKNTLGESPVWSVRDQCLYWISAPDQECWSWDLKSAPYRRLFDSVLGCVALKAGPPGSVVLAGERAFLSVDMSKKSQDFRTGPEDMCSRPEEALPTRPNDGRVDRQGRFVFGMYNNYHRGGSSVGENNAGLYRLDESGNFEQILDYKYRCSNCICFSPEGDKIYFCDTPTRKVYSFDYPTKEGGPLTNRRLVWTVPANLPGGPDGAQVDADGYLWLALSGSGRVVRIEPESGTVDTIVHLPVKSPTSLTFGGPDLDELFITTRGPDGGGLYRLKMPYGVKGLPEPEYEYLRKEDANMQ